MKNSVLDKLKSYFDEYFSDTAKPTARNLFFIVVFILTLDIFRSVRFAHRHVLSKFSSTSLSAYYYALKTDRLDHAPWRDVTVSKALKAVPAQLETQPLFLSMILWQRRKAKSLNCIERLINLECIAYSAMTLLPYSDESFSCYQSASAQENRFGIGQLSSSHR